MQGLQRRQLLPRGGVGRAAVPGGLVLESGESGEFGRVHGVPARIILRNRVDGSLAVRAWHFRVEHAAGRLRDVPCRRVSGRIGDDGLHGLRDWLVLPSRRVGATALLCGHLLEHPQPSQCLGLHCVPSRIFVLHWLDSSYTVFAWHVHRMGA